MLGLQAGEGLNKRLEWRNPNNLEAGLNCQVMLTRLLFPTPDTGPRWDLV